MRSEEGGEDGGEDGAKMVHKENQIQIPNLCLNQCHQRDHQQAGWGYYHISIAMHDTKPI